MHNRDMFKNKEYARSTSQKEVFQLWLRRLDITNSKQYIMSDIGGEKVAKIDQKLALVPRSIEKALEYIYAVAMAGHLSDPSTYRAMTYFIKKGVDLSDRVKHVDKYWRDEFNKSRQELEEVKKTAKLFSHSQKMKEVKESNGLYPYFPIFWDSFDFHEWEDDIGMFEFYKAASLKGDYDETFEGVVDSCRRPLGELITNIDLPRAAWILGSIGRTTWLKKELLSVCQEIVPLIPPPSSREFWQNRQLIVGTPLIGIEMSAEITLTFLKLSTRWDDILSVAQWLSHKQSKSGYWNEYYISDSTLRKIIYKHLYKNQDYYERSKFQPTCLVTELKKRLLLDTGKDQLSKTKQWILKQQDPRGFWNQLAIGTVDSTILALETLDLFSLPTSQAFVFPEASRNQIDELSNLPNKNYFISLFKAICNLVQQKEMPLTLIMMDLVKFKAINDNLGQTVGDQVIKNFGRHLARHFGQSGSPIRWGGDEFVVVFKPSGKKGEAKNITKRMLDTWSSSVSEVRELFHPLVRVGFACYPDDIEDPQGLEDLASARLKRLKGKKGLTRSLICDNGI